ncbi:hypothetical protein [Sulfuritalea sp.]|uniref:hypothetical protein n=1 Tax=Sulfuritalea sp. TaxID=2480090 RepID=UPI001ACBCB81|nr:hypothetical protein [Sulfuritalea sp.]MBN8474510.1 hypothetical protein [Sulfuritalea sp.]
MKKKPKLPAVSATGEIDISAVPLDQLRRAMTQGLAGPHLAVTRVIRAAEKTSGFGGDIDIAELGSCLQDQIQAVNRGDMKQVEAMLMSQAIGLQTLSARLIERAMAHDQIPGFDVNMRMALRAQNQCRTTLETLAGIKNPPVVYAKQANVTTGPQQVNNGVPVPSHAREIEFKQTQLSGGTYELLPNTGASKAKGRIDPAVAPLGKLHRTKN